MSEPEGIPEASGKHSTGLTARAAVATRAGPDGRTRITVLRSDGPLALRATPGGVYLDVSTAGPALYRGELAVGGPGTDRSSAVLGGAGAVGSVLLVDAAQGQPPPEVHEGLAILPLAGPGTAVSALAPDAALLASRLDRGERIAGC